MNRSEDALGNYYSISYTRAATVTSAEDSYARPERIDYTGNSGEGLTPYASVQFEYEDRQDVERKYSLTGPITTDKRLSHIKTYVGATMVRDYQLSYAYSASTSLSRLTSLKQCSLLGLCSEPAGFGWSDDGTVINAAHNTYATIYDPQNYQALQGDFNGDGLADVLLRTVNQRPDMYHANVGGAQGGFDWAFPYGSQTTNAHDFFRNRTFDYSATVGDFNGDGRDDLFVYPNDSGVRTAYVFLADANGVFSTIDQEIDINDLPIYYDYIDRRYHDVRAGDINGDGRDDLILLPNTSYYDSYSLLADANGHFNSIHESGFAPGNSSDYLVHSGDFNGDGRLDLLFQGVNNYNPHTNHQIFYSDGSGFFSDYYSLSNAGSGVDHLNWFTNKHKLYLGDYNGDGRTDIFMRTADASLDSHMLHANEQGQFNAASIKQSFPVNYLSLYWWFDLLVGDFNGDGRSDLLEPNSFYSLMLTAPDGTIQSVEQSWPGHYLSVDWNSEHPHFNIGDFNGDGRADLFLPKYGTSSLLGRLIYSQDGEAFPDQLTTITNGLGAVTEFTYKPLTDDTVYTKGTGATYPDQDVENSRYVVSALKQSDGIGGQFITSYTYEGARRHLTGRGDLGFAKITAVDQDRDSTSITEYEQSFPFSRLPKKVEVRRSSDNRLLSSTETSYQTHGTLGSGPVFPYVATRIAKQYALVDGRLLATTTTTNQCDAYGNIHDSRVLVNDHETNTIFEAQTLKTFNNDTANWRIGQTLSETQVNSLDGVNDPSLNITTEYSYDGATGLPLTITREPGAGAPLELTTTFAYDGFGNATSQTISGPGITSRTTTTGYDSRGQFPVTLTNALNHQESRSYDDRFGQMISQTGPNGLTTHWQLDDFGRVTLETRPDGTTSATSVHLDQSGTNPNAVFYTQVLTSGAGPVRTFHDSLGRTLRQRSQSFDGRYVQLDTEYDNQGRTQRTSEPYFVGSSRFWNTPTYDHLGRVTYLDAADNSQDRSSSYNGYTSYRSDSLGRTQTTLSNALGQVIETRDPANTATQFTYNQNGHRIEVKTAVGSALESTVTYVVDKLGRQIAMNDPDHGIYTYGYDSLGQKLMEISPKLDAANQNMEFQYDLLGRMTARIEPEGTTGWTYDHTASGNLGLGKVHSESQSGFSRTYSYAGSDYGRLSAVTTQIGSSSYTSTQTYDANGRLDTLTYPASAAHPTGLKVEHTYNALGYLERVQSPGGSQVYYQYLQSDAAGRMTQQWLGDGSVLDQSYQTHSSRIVGQHSSIGSTDIQQLTYAWNNVGNLIGRSDLINGLSETFSYDNLDRLTQAQVGAATAKDYGFNLLGNIISKSDVGNYSYNLAQPHAVGQVTQGSTQNTYQYDANGNLNSGDDHPSLTWASYNKPTQISKNGISYHFSYGPDRARYQKVHSSGGATTTTHYLGNFEQSDDGTTTQYRHHIRAGERVIAVLTDDGSSSELKYLHRDHLGSVTAITDTNGSMIERLSYDPWGQRRSASDWETITNTATDHRGYTGHEHLDDIGLIHMNGRVYSPKLGRFLSPDPVTQAPEDGQNYNRYSYVMNNPLKYTDPSGYCVSDAGCGETSGSTSIYGGGMGTIYTYNQAIFSLSGVASGLYNMCLDDPRICDGDLNGYNIYNYIADKNNQPAFFNGEWYYPGQGASSSSQTTTPDDSGSQEVVGDGNQGAQSRLDGILNDTRSKYFSDKIAKEHALTVKVDGTVDPSHIMNTTPDGSTILVHPDALDLSDQTLAWVFGHELVHVSDLLKFGFQPGSIDHFQSEIRAYQWQLDHAKSMGINLSWQDKLEIRDIIQDYRIQIQAIEIMQQF